MASVGTAQIDIDVDASGVSDALQKAMDKALASVSKSAEKAFSGVEKSADKAGKGVGDGIGDGAKAAQKAMDKIDGKGLDGVTRAASDAGKSVDGAAGSMSELATAATKAGGEASSAVSSSMAEVSDSAAEAAVASSASLADVGAAAAEAGVTASSSMAGSMADVSASAADAGAAAASSLSGIGGSAANSGAEASGSMSSAMSSIISSAAEAFASVGASAASAAGAVASSAADMGSSMTGALGGAGVGGAAASASGGMGGMLKKAGPLAAGLAGVAGAGATLKSGFDKLTSIEDTTKSLGIILGDVGDASTLMAQLREDNLTTPYMFDAYAGAGKTLAAFGAELDGIPQQVTALGEAAAASGGGQQVFDSMARSAGQAMSTGKISMDTINNLAIGGVKGLQILANEHGVTTAEMQKMISKGMIPAQEGMDALTKGIIEGSEGAAGATNAMGGVMEEMSQTASGSMTNLKAAFTNLGAAAIEPLVPIIVKVADALTDFAYTVIDLIGGDFDGWLGVVMDILEPLGIAIGVAATALGVWTVATKIATAVQGAFNAVMAMNPFVLIGVAIAGLVAGLIYFFTQTETGQRIWQGFMDGLTAAWEWLSGAFTDVWSTVSDAATTAFQWLSDAWDTMWEGLQAAWDAVGQPIVDFIVAAFTMWWDTVSLIFRLVGAAFEVIWTGMQMAWDAYGAPIVDWIVEKFQLFREGLDIAFAWIKDAWDTLWAGVRAAYDAVIAPVVDWIMDKFGVLRDGIQRAINAVQDVIQKMADKIGALYAEYVQPMVDNFLAAFDRMKETVLGIKDTIVDALASAGSWLIDTGKNIITGLIDGVKSMAGTLKDAFLSIVPEWIKGPFMEALGIESPSKVFAEYGANIGQGVVDGVRGTETDVSAATGDLAGAAVAGALAVGPAGPVVVPDAPMGAPMVSPAGPAPLDAGPVDIGALGGGGIGEETDLGAGEMASGMIDAFAAAGEGILGAKDGLIDPALAGVSEHLGLLSADTAINGQMMTDAMNLTGQGITLAKQGFVDPALAGMQAGMGLTAAVTQQQMLGSALPSMQQAGAGIMGVQTGTIDPALAATRGAVGMTAQAFGAGATGINQEWNRIRAGTADPARFVISTVFNDGIVGMWNSVSDLIDTPKMSPWPLRFATGGHVTGPGGPTDDKIPAWLSNNEYVLKASTVKKVGVGTLNALNSGAFSIAPGSIRSPRDGEAMARDKTISNMAQRYAGGGVVEGDSTWKRFKAAHEFGKRHSGKPYVWGGSIGPSGGTDCSGWVSSIADVVHGGNGLARQWATGSFPGGGGSQGASGPQGFVRGLGGGLSAGVSTIHMAGTLGGIPGLPNTNVESGGAHNYTAYGPPSVGADHSQFPSQYHLALPGLGMFRSGGGGGGGGIASMVAGLIGEKSDALQGKIDGYKGKGLAGQLPAAIGGKLREATEAMIAEKVNEVSGGADGDAESWRPMVIRALIKQGHAEAAKNSEIVDKFVRQIASESGGIEGRLQEIHDVNGTGEAAGVGLGQIIPGTFAAWRDPELPNDRKDGWANINAMVRYVMGTPGKLSWIGNGVGYDQGGIAEGMGLMPKMTLNPERVLSPRQTEAFEAWMGAGARIEDINKLVESVTWREDPANLPVVSPEKILNKDQESAWDVWHAQGTQIDAIHDLAGRMEGLQLDAPDVMGAEVMRRFTSWMADSPENTGDIRHLIAALESGVEWERVVDGMHRSAAAWANGQWVQIAEDKRLATPEEMSRQVGENMLEELADELGGMIGLKGLFKAGDYVGETGTVKLELPKDVEGAEVVPTTAGAEVVPTAEGAGTIKAKATGTEVEVEATKTGTVGEKETITMNVTINVDGVNDPMAVSDAVMGQLKRGVETAVGTARSQ